MNIMQKPFEEKRKIIKALQGFKPGMEERPNLQDVWITIVLIFSAIGMFGTVVAAIYLVMKLKYGF